MFDGLPAAAGSIRAARLKLLAMTGNERHPSFPGVPTFAEAGLPDSARSPGSASSRRQARRSLSSRSPAPPAEGLPVRGTGKEVARVRRPIALRPSGVRRLPPCRPADVGQGDQAGQHQTGLTRLCRWGARTMLA
ncbi:hypothetical protein [Variovorax boronicumulans]|uniref:hypothetical protein n=1 Tax=Variovorax boronicumulans TaxID=436515 RepID=UPI00358E0677